MAGTITRYLHYILQFLMRSEMELYFLLVKVENLSELHSLKVLRAWNVCQSQSGSRVCFSKVYSVAE